MLAEKFRYCAIAAVPGGDPFGSGGVPWLLHRRSFVKCRGFYTDHHLSREKHRSSVRMNRFSMEIIPGIHLAFLRAQQCQRPLGFGLWRGLGGSLPVHREPSGVLLLVVERAGQATAGDAAPGGVEPEGEAFAAEVR